jgi:prepilin-type N-terminal cleavage/methylation domain-containing protein
MNKLSKQRGFTLIELLIVVSLSVMLMLSASSLFMTFLLGNTKVARSQIIKHEGEYAMSQIDFLLRNAVQLVANSSGQVCAKDMTSVSFISLDSGKTTLGVATDPLDSKVKIASNSTRFLTSGDVTIIDGPFFDCVQSTDKLSQYLGVRFTLRKGTPSLDLARDIIDQEFISGVGLRSF